MSTKEWVSAGVTAMLVLCAIVIAGTAVHREFFAPPRVVQATGGPPRDINNWKQVVGTGHRIGAVSAPVTIVEFADFECPACRQFVTRTLRSAELVYKGQIAVVFRHWPLSYHKYAYPAARAAECAAAQGRFEQIYDRFYDGQDSLGVKSIADFAAESGVPDMDAFNMCNNQTSPVPAIDEDARVAVSLGAVGTPTIIINGKMFMSVPDSAVLDTTIARLIKKAR